MLGLAALTLVAAAGCSDDGNDGNDGADTPVVSEPLVPFDPIVNEGVDTPVEPDQPDNLNFDSPQPGFED